MTTLTRILDDRHSQPKARLNPSFSAHQRCGAGCSSSQRQAGISSSDDGRFNTEGLVSLPCAVHQQAPPGKGLHRHRPGQPRPAAAGPALLHPQHRSALLRRPRSHQHRQEVGRASSSAWADHTDAEDAAPGPRPGAAPSAIAHHLGHSRRGRQAHPGFGEPSPAGAARPRLPVVAPGAGAAGRGGQVGAGVVLVLDMMCVGHALGPVQDPRVRETPAQLGGEPRLELGHLVAVVDELDSAEL